MQFEPFFLADKWAICGPKSRTCDFGALILPKSRYRVCTPPFVNGIVVA